jgi:polyhydroxybutyrate depolymerase
VRAFPATVRLALVVNLSVARTRLVVVFLVALVIAASLLTAASGTSSVDRTSARAAQAAQPSCPPGGLTVVDHGQLRMPPGAKPGATRLLVAVMSGGDGDADDYLRLGATANREGIAVLYPTGRAGSIWQITKKFGSSDVQVVRDLLDRVQASGCFDPNKISITGVSNGAGFAVRMACTLQDRFAAVVAVAAGYRALDPCPGVRASFLAIHGSADTIVPFNGRPPDYKGNVLRYAGAWAQRDGCSATPSSYRARHDVTSFVFAGCPAGMRVQVLRLEGTDHGWPGATPPFPSRNPSGVNANLEVVRFVRHAVRPS